MRLLGLLDMPTAALYMMELTPGQPVAPHKELHSLQSYLAPHMPEGRIVCDDAWCQTISASTRTNSIA